MEIFPNSFEKRSVHAFLYLLTIIIHIVRVVCVSQVHSQEPENRGARTALFFRDLCVRTAHLVSAWQCLGFCHGLAELLLYMLSLP